jgi:PAS domain S-box-containing protein
MFKLLRYFSITSAAAVVAVSTFLVFHYRQNAVDNLVDLAERQNLVLARSFANIIWPRFSAYVKSTPGIEGDTLRDRQETQEIHQALMALTARLPVLKVKIYNLDGLTVYSSKPDEVGIYKINNPGLVAAARQGRLSSKLTFRDTISSFEGTVQDRDLVESYLPIRHGNGPVEGVFELYSDVTPLIATIERTTIELIVSFVLVFGLLYGGLLLIVHRADRILRRQYVSLEEEITERKEAEEALKKARDGLEQRVEERTQVLNEEIAERRIAEESLRKLSRAVEQSPAMTIITDCEGKIEYVNPRFSKVTGYNLDEISRGTPQVLKSGEMPPENYEELWKTIKAGREWKGEFYNKKKNGEFYWAATSISPVMTPDGVITHFLGISEDITEKKRTEEEARQQRSELAHAGRVIIMGEMATSLAHELNQPLAVISGRAQSCLKTLRSGKGKLENLIDPLERIFGQKHALA